MCNSTDLAQATSDAQASPHSSNSRHLATTDQFSSTLKYSTLCTHCQDIGEYLYSNRESVQLLRTPLPRKLFIHECDLCWLISHALGHDMTVYSTKDHALVSYLPSLLSLRHVYLERAEHDSDPSRIATLFFSWSGPEDRKELIAGIRPMEPNFEQCRSWLQHCYLQHRQCGLESAALQPTRIVKLTGIDCELGRLMILPADAPYVTLSYVWGQFAPRCTPDSFRVSELEETIKDAVEVVRRLGLRYLWVDRYCLPQNHADKDSQISTMDEIYSQSCLTIIAATGSHADEGIPGMSQARLPNPYALTETWRVQLCYPDTAFYGLLSSEWYTRAWTYQEGLLAQRRLAFGRDFMYFQCRGMSCDEISSHASGLSRPVFEEIRQTHDSRTLVEWIDQYNHRRFSHSSDGLNAFLGILGRFRKWKPPVYHICGNLVFPRPMFTNTSSWSRSDRLKFAFAWSLRVPQFVNQEPVVRRSDLPSWSWTAWEPCAHAQVWYEVDHNISPSLLFLLPEEDDLIAEAFTSCEKTVLSRASALTLQGWACDLQLDDNSPMLGHRLDVFFEAGDNNIYWTTRNNLSKVAQSVFQNPSRDFYRSNLVTILLLYQKEQYKTFSAVVLLSISESSSRFVRLPSMLRFRCKASLERDGKLWLLSHPADDTEPMIFDWRTVTLV